MLDAFVLPVLQNLAGTVTHILPGTLALAVVFTLLGWLAKPCNPGFPWWRKPGLVTDFVFMFMIPIVGGWARVLFLAAGMLLVYRLDDPAAIAGFFKAGHGPLSGLPLWAQVPVYLALADVMMYGTHRAFHTMSLWRYHAIHHAPEHLDWTSATRFHPINIIFHSVLADAILLLAGIAPDTLVLVAPFNVAMSAFVHANLDWTLGPFRYVIASPVFHRWHHTDPARGGSMNFAPTFPIIDIAFGTFFMPRGELPDRFGVDDRAFPEGLVGQLAYPFRPPETAKSAAGPTSDHAVQG